MGWEGNNSFRGPQETVEHVSAQGDIKVEDALGGGGRLRRVLPELSPRGHTGFGTHVSRPIRVREKTPGVVARYMARPPVTPERMLGEADEDQIIYRSDAVHPRH